MPGNRLTLSTDDGEQAGEENDRMAPHHLFHLPSRLEAIFTRSSSSSSSLFSFLAARVDRSAFPSRNQNENTLLLRSSRPSSPSSPFASRSSTRRPARGIRSCSRADHSMVFPWYRSRLDRQLTSRKILRSALISLVPSRPLARSRGVDSPDESGRELLG